MDDFNYLSSENIMDCERDHEAKMLNEFFNQQLDEEPAIHWKPVAKDVDQNLNLLKKMKFER